MGLTQLGEIFKKEQGPSQGKRHSHSNPVGAQGHNVRDSGGGDLWERGVHKDLDRASRRFLFEVPLRFKGMRTVCVYGDARKTGREVKDRNLAYTWPS